MGVKERILEDIRKSNCSTIWGAIAKVWPLLRENLCWSIGTGASVRFWEDSWIPKVRSLTAYVPLTKCLLKDMVMENGVWDLKAFKE